MKTNYLILLVLLSLSSILDGQTLQRDSIKINYGKIFSNCLNGDIAPALQIMEQYESKDLSAKDLKFKTEFENRFKFNNDSSDFLISRPSPITDLLTIYRDYWRMSLLDNSKNHDSLLMRNLSAFFASKYPQSINHASCLSSDSLDFYLRKHVTAFGYHTTGFGRTGKLLDLLVWKEEKDTTYTFSIFDQEVKTPIVFMDGFITLGWEEYATLGRAYPGGWANKNSLNCVKKAYELDSEDFLIRYLCHEGRHFLDYQLFPDITGADLEYRAKLTELSLLNESLFETISLFVNNAVKDSDNAHSVANYKVVSDLSKKLFRVDFVSDMEKWKCLDKNLIHKTAHELLILNAKTLNARKKA